ncbi:acyltransferase [Acinetobacter chinensis]|uniref:Acyltransferase n=1 Tax=Acinetobacter chinensis TaxID=2004650 RepID=A0ABU3WIG9_9GAMM|nr:acyltransferase [Acinetobacter chinensis]MDV2470207.1 acyltransferase [Acinetobacter chinensis]
MKNKLKRLVLPILRSIVCLFYDKQYIRGRYFDDSYLGYKIALKSIWAKNILRLNTPQKFPTAINCHISNGNNVIFHPDDINNFQSPGTYYQNFKAKIFLGKGSYIGPNVGIITANHIIGNLDQHDEGQDVIIGEQCWIGMNSVILPGVVLGNNIVVAAGSVVNRSFTESGVIIGGAPAKILKKIEQYENIHE